jgi:hypothetical protein
VYIPNVSPISNLCYKYFISDVIICCKRMFHLVSVRCSRCYSPRALTHGHARAACTHLTLPISVMQASSNSSTCTQRTVSAPNGQALPGQKCMRACRVPKRANTQRTQNQAPLHHQAWSPMVEHEAKINTGCVRCAPTLSLTCS